MLCSLSPPWIIDEGPSLGTISPLLPQNSLNLGVKDNPFHIFISSTFLKHDFGYNTEVFTVVMPSNPKLYLQRSRKQWSGLQGLCIDVFFFFVLLPYYMTIKNCFVNLFASTETHLIKTKSFLNNFGLAIRWCQKPSYSGRNSGEQYLFCSNTWKPLKWMDNYIVHGPVKPLLASLCLIEWICMTDAF